MTLEEETAELGCRLVRKGGYPALCGFSRRSGREARNLRPFPLLVGKSDELPLHCQDLRGAALALDLGP